MLLDVGRERGIRAQHADTGGEGADVAAEWSSSSARSQPRTVFEQLATGADQGFPHPPHRLALAAKAFIVGP